METEVCSAHRSPLGPGTPRLGSPATSLDPAVRPLTFCLPLSLYPSCLSPHRRLLEKDDSHALPEFRMREMLGEPLAILGLDQK